MNLLSNGVKFTPSGSVTVEARLLERTETDALLEIKVRDTGIGVPLAVQENLFEPFVQADSSTTRRFGGTGLGLAICKRLAELMRGEIGVISVNGEGSTFWFTAEFEHATIDIPRPSLAPQNFGAHHALIVDDNATNRKLLTHLCRLWRLPHAAADSTESALAQMREAASKKHPFDLVILDHHMPEKDGSRDNEHSSIDKEGHVESCEGIYSCQSQNLAPLNKQSASQQTVGPINPLDTANLQQNMTEGKWVVKVSSGNIKPATLTVGSKRSSSSGDLLLP